MRDPALVISTPFALSREHACAMLGLAAAPLDAVDHADGALLVAIVERPALGLAAALTAGEVDDPAAWLHEWRAGALRVLACAQRKPERCLLVDAEDALKHPDALVRWLESRLGLLPPQRAGAGQPAPPADPGDALGRALAEALAFADAEVQALQAELLASCALIEDGEPASDDSADRLCIDGAAAAQCLRRIRDESAAARGEAARAASDLARIQVRVHEQATGIERLTAELAQVRRGHMEAEAGMRTALGELKLASDRHALATDALAQETAELEASRRELAKSRQEGELLMLQLHRVQEELENVFQAYRAAEAQCQDAAAARDVAALEVAGARRQIDDRTQAVDDLSVQLQQMQARLAAMQDESRLVMQQRDQARDDMVQAVDALSSQLQQVQSRLAALQDESRDLTRQRDQARDHASAQADLLSRLQIGAHAAQRERELLVDQLHRVQEDQERFFLRCRELEDFAAAARVDRDGSDLSVGRMVILHERDTPPHRELSLALHEVAIVDRRIDTAIVRLVEHHGRPGMVVFGQEQEPQLLMGWKETGQEDGRPYMLLVPEDDHGAGLLDAMASRDWRRVHALAALMEAMPADVRLPQSGRWSSLARRLRVALAELPSRFRCEAVSVEPVPHGLPGELSVRFDDVDCGSRRIGRLVVSWVPEGATAGVALHLDADAGPPLPSWPDDEQGVRPDRIWMPLGGDAPGESKRVSWLGLPGSDRQFMACLLAALPDSLARASDAHGIISGLELVTHARTLLPDALAAISLPVEPSHKGKVEPTDALARARDWMRRRAHRAPRRQGDDPAA